MVKHIKMTDEQIKQAAKEYCNAFSVKGEPFERPVTMAYVAGAQSRQPEIDDLTSKLNQALILIDDYRMFYRRLLNLKK